MALLFALSASAQTREVLIYLGNEPSPTVGERQNIAQIVGWLQAELSSNDRLLAAGILEDLRSFPAAVDADVRVIARNSQRLSGVVVATNRLLQSGSVLVGRDAGVLEALSIVLPLPRDSREASSPLSNATNVELVFELAAATFAPAEYEFVIVVASHGDELYAMTPRMGLPTAGLTRETLLARVHGTDNAFIERYGISTASLLDLLVEKRKTRGFRTSLLVLASCKSTIESLQPEIPLALVAAGGQALPFGVINYEWILNSTEPTLHEAFVSALTPTPFEVADPEVVARRRSALRRDEVLAVLPYSAPLVLWFVVFFWRRRSNSGCSKRR